MTNKEFIQCYPVEYCLPKKEADELRKVIKKASESYALECVETKGVKCGNLQYYDFKIFCTTTGFANAYAHLGLLYAEQVLPIWKKRFNKNKTNARTPNKRLSKADMGKIKGLNFKNSNRYKH